jgi:hypothetical protein
MIINTVIQTLSQLVAQLDNLNRSGASDTKTGPHRERCLANMRQIERDFLPSGSGFDTGTRISVASTPQKIFLNTDFHHMDETGYTHWTTHRVTVRPEFLGINIKVSGPDTNNFKDFAIEIFETALTTRIQWDYSTTSYRVAS